MYCVQNTKPWLDSTYLTMLLSDSTKIGFACKFMNNELEHDKSMNLSTTTLSWLKKQPLDIAITRLHDLMVNNIDATYNLVKTISQFEPNRRMVRIGSDVLPAYTADPWSTFWSMPDTKKYLEFAFRKIGDLARATNTRLSFHPGQFCVLASENPNIVENSIREFEYHVDMARWMGYGKQFQDFKINVHISGKAGPDGIIKALGKLSPEGRNMITIENEEMTWGLDDCLRLKDHCALVLDLHHHWVKTGEYIDSADSRIEQIKHSWRGIRPVIHYSVSREDCLVNHCSNTLPDRDKLMSAGIGKMKLRAHSDRYWNQAVNEWALTHSEWADIMCEAKHKNLAVNALVAV